MNRPENASWVTRAQWGAQPPRWVNNDSTGQNGVVIHHVGAGSFADRDPYALVRDIQAWHYARTTSRYADIAYNLLVAPGLIFEGRSVRGRPATQPGATGTANKTTFAVCALVGTADGPAPDELVHTLGEAVRWLRDHAHAKDRVTGHRDWMNTDCPGHVYARLDDIAAAASGRTPAPPPPAPPPAPADKPPYPFPYPPDHFFGPPPASGYRHPERVHNGKSDPVAYGHVQTIRTRMRQRGWSEVADSGHYTGPMVGTSWGLKEEVAQFQSQVMGEPPGDGYVGPRTWNALWEIPVS